MSLNGRSNVLVDDVALSIAKMLQLSRYFSCVVFHDHFSLLHSKLVLIHNLALYAANQIRKGQNLRLQLREKSNRILKSHRSGLTHKRNHQCERPRDCLVGINERRALGDRLIDRLEDRCEESRGYRLERVGDEMERGRGVLADLATTEAGPAIQLAISPLYNEFRDCEF